MDLTLARDAVTVRWRGAPAPGPVAIVLDGAVQAVVEPGPDGLRWIIPPTQFGRLLELRTVPDGAALLDAPADLSAVRTVRWDSWERVGDRVDGAFEADTDATWLPVALVADGTEHASGFARREDGRYRFALRLSRLPGGVAGLALQPIVGGLLLPPVLHIPPDAFAQVGFLESSEPWRVRGWAADRRQPGAPVPLELWLDGRLVRRFETGRARADVAALGFGADAGFDIALPAPLDRAVRVDVRVAGGPGGGPSLGNSPFVRPAAPRFIGWFDGVDGISAGGWAIDLAAPGRPVAVEAWCDGAIVGRSAADLHRGDVEQAGLPTARCGFHLLLDRPATELVGREVTVTIAGTALQLPGSPRTVTLNPNAAAFLRRRPPAAPERLRRRLSRAVAGTTISIIMPVHDTKREWLEAAIGSVRDQWSSNWELICVDDGSVAPHVGAVLAAAAEGRVRVVRQARTGGIARAVNAGLRVATGAYVAVLDHDDALEPDAVYHLARAARSGAGLIYSDEVLTGPSLQQVLQHRARPAWSHDYYLSHPYFVHLVAVRRALALELGGWDETMTISADVDFVLRAAERAGTIAHVPRVLYRWRTHPGSTGHQRQGDVMAATGGAIARHLRRLGLPATVRPGLGFNQFRLDWPDPGGEILVVVPTRDRLALLRRCIDSLKRTAGATRFRLVVVDHQSEEQETIDYLRTLRHPVLPYAGPFNFAAMNNRAVAAHAAGAEFVLFLNNDVEATAPGWMERLRSLAARSTVGAVGPMLLYDNGRVQHAGVIVGIGPAADHAMRFADPLTADGARDPGYNSSLTSVRDFSAVTAACLMMRRSVFEAVGGFDEAFAVGFNDTDLCLRLGAAGLSVLYDGHTVLLHHESATRAGERALADPTGDEARFKARWPGYADGADPFYSPALSVRGADHRLRDEPIRRGLGVRIRPAPG